MACSPATACLVEVNWIWVLGAGLCAGSTIDRFTTTAQLNLTWPCGDLCQRQSHAPSPTSRRGRRQQALRRRPGQWASTSSLCDAAWSCQPSRYRPDGPNAAFGAHAWWMGLESRHSISNVCGCSGSPRRAALACIRESHAAICVHLARAASAVGWPARCIARLWDRRGEMLSQAGRACVPASMAVHASTIAADRPRIAPSRWVRDVGARLPCPTPNAGPSRRGFDITSFSRWCSRWE